MSAVTTFRALAIATTAALTLGGMSASASAQGLFDALWGGGEEWGGKRTVVAFPKQYTAGQIVVSFGDRRLYHITRPGSAVSYPIAVPREKSRWSGVTSVSAKRENPDWTPTPEMFRENPRLPPWVPGGHPMNPLGVRAMYLGGSTYRIHGTDAPWTIGQAVSKGCIRMFNEDVKELYPKVAVGTKVTVTWDRFNGAITTAAASQGEPSQGVAVVKPATKVSRSSAKAETSKPDTAQAEQPKSEEASVEPAKSVSPSSSSEPVSKGSDMVKTIKIPKPVASVTGQKSASAE